MIGKTISHYFILEKLGQGGMGVVYKAEDTKLKRTVALKFITPLAMGSEEEKTRFVHEAQAAAALDDSNICSVHEIEEVEGQPFIVMAYVDGESLKEKIATGPLKIEEAVNIAIQISEGLQAAHEKGIVHRDIKPANILVNKKRQVRITDLGLAKLTGRTRVTRTGTTMGTIAYMSPEQARGEQVDHRTDIWSLGVVLYEMLIGQLPFRGEYEQAVVYSIMSEEPEPPTALRTGVPIELERIANKTLAKNPEERYQNLNDLLVDLRAVRKSLAAKESALVPESHLRKPTRVKPLKPLFMYGAVVIVLAVLISAWWMVRLVSIAPRKPAAKKIAVLLFVNLTADPEQEYFCDGMTKQLITNLSRVPKLKVIARTSVMRYKNTEKDIRQISKELDAKYVLEGSVRKADRRVRITAQLIEAQEGTHLWANDYDRELQDIFAIQDDVSQSIALALEVAFSGEAERMVQSSYSSNFEAYDSHLKTRYFVDNVYLKTRQEGDFRRALEIAQRTVALDPDHYLGYFDLGYLHEVHWAYTGNPQDSALTRKYVYQAYRLNPNLPETNAAMSYMYVLSGKLDSAFFYTKKALALHANAWDPLQLIATNLAALGLYHQAIQFCNKVAELNPFHMYTLTNRGLYLLLVGEVNRALQDFTRSHKIQPDYVANLNGLAMALILKERYQEADSLLRHAERQPPGPSSPYLKFIRALYFATLGEKEKALALNRWPGVLAMLGMKDEAIVAISDGIKNRRNGYLFLSYLALRHLSIYDSLRDEPKIQEILGRQKEVYEEWLEKYSLIGTN